MTERPIPKSLHTVTVLVNLARHLMKEPDEVSPDLALGAAVEILGLNGMPDPYGLVQAARKQLEPRK